LRGSSQEPSTFQGSGTGPTPIDRPTDAPPLTRYGTATLVWARGAVAGPAAVRCLWQAGYPTRRRHLASSLTVAGSDDRELVAAAVRVHGDEAPSRLEGPLSWVAWDGSRGRLTAVRDRIGVEPLYYAERGDRVAVGPRPAELAGALGLSPSPDPEALAAHLNGHAPPAGRSFFSGVCAVPPGAAVDFERDATRVRRYWRPEIPPTLRLGSEAEYAEALRELLAEVARDHRVDGAAVSMSGGLDSTSVAAMLRSVAPSAELVALHRTAPEIEEADESAFARAAAERLGLRYEAVRVDRHWPLSSPEGLVTGEDSPLLPPYAEAWQASWSRARELGVGTVFTGAGGDHLFGGSRIYPYADLLLRGRWVRLAREMACHRERFGVGAWAVWRRNLLRPLLRAYLPRWRPAGRSAAPWLGPAGRRHWQRVHGEAMRRDRGYPPLLPARRDRLRFLTDARISELIGALARHAGRHGIALRHPLLDPRLFAFALSLPAEQSFSAGAEKAILRRAMRGELPDELLDRRDKVFPFAIFHRGLREREVERVRALLTDMRAADAELVDPSVLAAAYERYRRGESDGGGLLWSALTLEDWLRRYF